jgi:hypothetical protein
MRPAATLVKFCIYQKITQHFKQLEGVVPSVIFHARPANLPTVTVVALCQKRLETYVLAPEPDEINIRVTYWCRVESRDE